MNNKATYTDICQRLPQIPVFAQAWWMDAVCADWDVAIARKGDNIAGVWPYPLEAHLGVAMLRNPLLTPYLGPAVCYPADMKTANRDGYEHETISELIKQLPKAPYWHLALQPGLKQAGLLKAQKLELGVQQTFLVDLAPPEAELLANMKDSMRKNIRQATAELVTSNEPESLPSMYDFNKATLGKKKKDVHYTLAHLQRIMDAALTHNATALWVARLGTDIQAMVWQVWDAGRSYYFMGAQATGNNNYKAMSLLLWRSIKHSKTLGHQYLDLEGSMDEGVERFFRSFGAQRELYLVLHKNESLTWKLKQKLVG